MPVVMVHEHRSKCQCKACRAIRYPETPEETGRRSDDEVFRKATARIHL